MKSRNILLIIILIGAFLRLYGVSTQPALKDEALVAFSAINYVEGGQLGPSMWYHPNIRNIFIYGITKLFGYGAYPMRGASLLLGILSIPLVYLIVKLLTEDERASLLSSFFLSMDQVHITFSRQAIQETWTTFFFLLGVLLSAIYLKKGLPYHLVLAGAVFGLGVGSKFHAIPPLVFCLCVGLYISWKKRSTAEAVFVLCALAILPFLIYLLTHIPWFGRGYDLSEWVYTQRALLAKTLTHTGNPMDQIIDISAWQWFLLPMGYAVFTLIAGIPYISIAYSNPFLWFAVLPSTAYAAWKSKEGFKSFTRLRTKSEGTIFIWVLFLISYLPLALSPRPIWLLTSLAVLPFAFMLVSIAISEMLVKVQWGRNALIAYIIIVFLSSIALYPMAIGKAKEYDYLHDIVERFRPPFEKQ